MEADAEGLSVGIGGLPDRDGNVTLDACIMDHTQNAGSVCFVQDIAHPITLARKVMEDTPARDAGWRRCRAIRPRIGHESHQLTDRKSTQSLGKVANHVQL